MKNENRVFRHVFLAMMVAVGVVISPILRVEGMCPMAHFINITVAVLMGPWYSFLCAVLIGVIRMAVMGIPPLALTGAVFGAALSGIFYKISKGTGIIGAIVSFPVMALLWGRNGLTWMFYVPSFFMGTVIGGSIAFVFLTSMQHSGMLLKMQRKLGGEQNVRETLESEKTAAAQS